MIPYLLSAFFLNLDPSSIIQFDLNNAIRGRELPQVQIQSENDYQSNEHSYLLKYDILFGQKVAECGKANNIFQIEILEPLQKREDLILDYFFICFPGDPNQAFFQMIFEPRFKSKDSIDFVKQYVKNLDGFDFLGTTITFKNLLEIKVKNRVEFIQYNKQDPKKIQFRKEFKKEEISTFENFRDYFNDFETSRIAMIGSEVDQFQTRVLNFLNEEQSNEAKTSLFKKINYLTIHYKPSFIGVNGEVIESVWEDGVFRDCREGNPFNSSCN